MKFYVDAQDMLAGILSVVKALPVRSPMPVLDGILVEARDNAVHLACSDLMYQKECTLPATVEEDGACVVKGKFFADVLRKMPNESIAFELEGLILKLACGRTKQRLQCIEYDVFPLMQVKGATNEIRLDKDVCRRMIDQTVFAVSQDDSRPVLTGTLLESDGDTLTMVATDSFQFAMSMQHVAKKLPTMHTIVQGKVLSEIARMEEESEKEVVLSLSATHITVEVNQGRLTARLLDGNYIDYKRIIPKECKTRVLVDTNEIVEMIDRAQLIAREGNNSIVMHFEEDNMLIKAESFLGRVEDNMEVQIVGEPLDIAFNPKYCLNIFKNISDEKVYMEFNSAISPCVIRPVQGDGYLYLIVPMRVY